jgi:lysozyme family protein
MTVLLTGALGSEYQNLFDTCEIQPVRQAAVEKVVATIAQNQTRYQAVAAPLGIPWFFLGAIHNMESSLNFKLHLHNGDPLTARTVHVPPGRPLTGSPPFPWEASVTDALQLERLDQVTDWTLPGILYQMEKYNGFGYRTRHPEVLSPYLWSGSRHYTSGKFVADGKFDPDAVSEQCGAAVILRRMADRGIIPLPGADEPSGTPEDATSGTLAALESLVTFSETKRSEAAKELQRALNTFPGIAVDVDGVPGTQTSDALHQVALHFLRGDPRA